ncbi:DnaJ domain-containing protein [Synechococcus sp. M16CYN]|uniref:J domain-containing protein n=1 Tax=Synechococcus sp. M16CYN TaxID=3103139 RepID=UPI0030E4EE93
MGFDPRQWSAGAHSYARGRVTSNVESLLAENELLRQEVQSLRRQLDEFRCQQNCQPKETQTPRYKERNPNILIPRVTVSQVEGWGKAMAEQKGWHNLHLNNLLTLIEQLNSSSFYPQLNLQQRLDRLMPRLGSDLYCAISGSLTKKHSAVLAAFALYGIRTNEWLDKDPQRVVTELCNRQEMKSSRRYTRTDRRSSDSYDHNPQDPRIAALKILGLQIDASTQTIKQAHRRLVKQHHPDLGGSVETFRRVNEAYQFLLS